MISSRWFVFLILALLILFGFAAYINSLNNPLYYDDVILIIDNTAIRNLTRIPHFFYSHFLNGDHTFTGYRPLVMASFAINYAISGVNPFYYHLTNLVLHIIAAWLVYLVFCQLFLFHKISSKDARLWSALLALFFLLHPINNITVNFIWKRSIQLSTICLLTILLIWFKKPILKGFLKKIANPACLVLFIIGSLAREDVVILPILLILINLSRSEKSFKERIKKVACDRLILMSILLSLIFIYFRLIVIPEQFSGIEVVEGGAPRFDHSLLHDYAIQQKLQYLKSQSMIFPRYLALLISPGDLSLIHHLPKTEGFKDPLVLSCLTFCIGYLLSAIALWRDYRLYYLV